jgi:CRISPR-associated protein Cas5 subtype I-A
MRFLAVSLRLPLFSIRDPESWGVRLSFVLPPPRSLLGALARGLGIILGFRSGEEKQKNEFVRDILTFGIEVSSYATIRQLSPLLKSSYILRYVPPVEKGEPIETVEGSHDAFKTDLMFSGMMKIIFSFDIAKINSVFKTYDLPKVDEYIICQAAKLIDRIGSTENFCHAHKVEFVNIEEISPTVNTYVPLDWIESVKGEYFISDLLPNIRILKDAGVIKDESISNLQDKDLRRMKMRYVFPLKLVGEIRGKMFFESDEVEIMLKKRYSGYILNDGTRVVIPSLGKNKTGD